MKAYLRIAALLIAAMAVMSGQVSALSIREYDSKTIKQRAEFVATEIAKIVADTDKVDPALSKAIHDYFHQIPQGQPGSPGADRFRSGASSRRKNG